MSSGVVRMTYTIENRDFQKVEGAYPVQTRYVYPILVLIGSALMMCVNSAMRAEEVLR